MRNLDALLTSLVNIDRHSLVAILTSEAVAAQRSVKAARQRTAAQRGALLRTLAIGSEMPAASLFSRNLCPLLFRHKLVSQMAISRPMVRAVGLDHLDDRFDWS